MLNIRELTQDEMEFVSGGVAGTMSYNNSLPDDRWTNIGTKNGWTWSFGTFNGNGSIRVTDPSGAFSTYAWQSGAAISFTFGSGACNLTGTYSWDDPSSSNVWLNCSWTW